MSATDRITLVLKPHAGTTIEDLQQYAKLGMPVGVGRSLGVIAGASEGDVMERAEQLESQVILAEAAITRNKVYAAGWTDAQVLDFLSVALRHVVVQGELKYSDINDALKYMADKGKPAFVPSAPFGKDSMPWDGLRKVIGQLVAMGEMGTNEARGILTSLDKDRVNQISETGENVNQTAQSSASLITENPVIDESMHIDDRIKEVAAKLDPRNLFARINPIGASAEELEMGRNGFVDDRVHGDYLIWKSGFNAALEVEQ